MRKFAEIRAADLPPDVRRLGLAVSGGADSTALLMLLAPVCRAAGIHVCVLHVDHGLRPDSADDARFVKALAARYGLPFHSTRLHIRRRRGESTEMAARRGRMDFLRRQFRRLKLDAIATGHHADDVAETLLLRLARGAGATGLSGLRPESVNGGLRIIRPLLRLGDADLRGYLRRHGQEWREDSTNADTTIARNRVRRVVLPFLERNFDPAIRAHLAQSAEILREDDAALEALCDGADGAGAPLALRRRLVRRRLIAAGADAGFRAVESALASTKPAADAPPGVFALKVAATTGYERRPDAVGRLPAVCWMGAAALRGRTLLVRTWRAGDRITPTGFPHAKKLQDLFVTAKVPSALRAALPLVADAATGEVLWVPGYRVAAAAAVASPDAPSLRFELSGGVRP